MDFEKVMSAIEKLVLKMKNAEELERVQIYTTIYTLLLSIKEWDKENESNIPNLEMYSGELLSHCESMAGLNDGNGHDIMQHFSWAYGAVGKLKSYHCLNV